MRWDTLHWQRKRCITSNCSLTPHYKSPDFRNAFKFCLCVNTRGNVHKKLTKRNMHVSWATKILQVLPQKCNSLFPLQCWGICVAVNDINIQTLAMGKQQSITTVVKLKNISQCLHCLSYPSSLISFHSFLIITVYMVVCFVYF